MPKGISDRLIRELIWVNPARVSGEPCFRGTRVPVARLFEYLAAGESLDESSCDDQRNPWTAPFRGEGLTSYT
jgi:hypothetical protein